ncbi:MAG: glutamine synthetase III [Planctomycetia bacterium]|nr:glutamine synthetase III [Planctomycetia bacterium]
MNARYQAVQSISDNTPIRGGIVDYQSEKFSELYASYVFHEEIQRERLPSKVFKSLQNTIKTGDGLDPEVAETVAMAMRDWALEHGATHYSHWFQPLTGSTAEKHDCFLTPHDGLHALARFSGNELIRGESDASSFPSGGLRATFEARGYTAWDPSSPAFILKNPNGATLVIPTMFVSWTGESLDQKTPMLRSLGVLNHHAMRVLRLLGNTTAQRVECTLGVEQEYFLVDRRLAMLRPDLMIAGRTLFGARPPKGQELDDNYFGAIPERVLAFMTEVEHELILLGVPIKTRHNEVAPGQYELAPTFETTNLALDHQMLVMQLLQQVAQRHGFLCILHEKPFAGVNGSGKHNNWSIGTDDGENLLEPGETPESNAVFLIFCAAVCRAVHKYSALLRFSVASPGNDFRLGASEAPPAIMSIHLGNVLTDIFNLLLEESDAGSNQRAASKKSKKSEKSAQTLAPAPAPLHIGLPMLLRLPRHSGDRNRTSPFAFTGNKFEFRAVGSSQNSAGAVTVLNTIVAESLDFIATRLEEARKSEGDFNAAVRHLLVEMIEEFKPILFDGDNYSMAWLEESHRRGLPNLRNTVDCLPVLTSSDSVELFQKYRVYTEGELHGRQEILAEIYCTTILIEANAMLRIARTMILPAVLRHKSRVQGALTTETQKDFLVQYDEKIDLLLRAIDELNVRLSKIKSDWALLKKAEFFRDSIQSAMFALRVVADKLESMTDDAVWPLPTYSEMLFLR